MPEQRQPFTPQDTKLPVLFVGHGNPMNAIEDNEFSRAWIQAGRSLPKPQAILCISAHWETVGTQVTAMEQPRTIHDFLGFPRRLYEVRYPAPGSSTLAQVVQETVRNVQVLSDYDWGLDHGCWSVLCRLFPEANIPVVQLSLDTNKEPAAHYELGKELHSLRRRGVLIVGSGNIVHNLGILRWEGSAYDWAIEMDLKIKQAVLSGDIQALIHYEKWGHMASLAIPTNEHYLPLLYVLAMQEEGEEVSFFAEKVTLGSVSMRALRIG